MYAWIWSHLPGSRDARTALALVLVAATLAACCLWVFPAISNGLARGDHGIEAPPPTPRHHALTTRGTNF